MTRPDLRELQCFVAVADHLNFSRAARELNLSQPPLTRHIQALEARLGCRLLERNTHSVSLTRSGSLFLQDARAILAHLDRSIEAVRRAEQGEPDRLRLAFVGALLDERLVRLIRRFRKDHPGCQVQIADLSPAAQIEALQAGHLDGGFIGAQPERPLKGIGFAPWHSEPFLLAVPEDHPLAKGKIQSWSQLKNLPWIMVSRSAAPAFRRQFSELARRHGVTERVIQESERVPAVLTMVSAGSGVTIVPQSAAHLLSEGVRFRKLPNPQFLFQQTFAHRRPPASSLARDFLDLLNLR